MSETPTTVELNELIKPGQIIVRDATENDSRTAPVCDESTLHVVNLIPANERCAMT